MSADPISRDVPAGVHLDPEQGQAIETILGQLVERCPARLALVAKTTGEVVSVGGDSRPESIDSLAALVAGSVIAGQAVSRLVGEPQPDPLFVQEGQQGHYLTQIAGEHLILFVQVDPQVPLGWARLSVQTAGRQMAAALAAPAAPTISNSLLPANFVEQMTQDLNALWME